MYDLDYKPLPIDKDPSYFKIKTLLEQKFVLDGYDITTQKKKKKSK